MTDSLKRNTDGSISIDFDAMREAVKDDEAKRTKRFKEHLDHLNDTRAAEQAEMNELFAQAVLSDRAERKRIEDKRIDEENARLMAKHEAEQEAKHLPTEHSDKLDAAYRKLLG